MEDDHGWSNNKGSKSSRFYVSKTMDHHHQSQSIFSSNDQKLKSNNNNIIPAYKNSKLISKKQLKRNKIRIIHIIPPQIIQTDKANFRNLVQRLTGRCQYSISSANTPRITKNLIQTPHEVHGFGSDRFLELGEVDLTLISLPSPCNWEVDLFRDF